MPRQYINTMFLRPPYQLEGHLVMINFNAASRLVLTCMTLSKQKKEMLKYKPVKTDEDV